MGTGLLPVHGITAVQSSWCADDEVHVFCGQCRRWFDVPPRRSADDVLTRHLEMCCVDGVIGA